MSWKSLVLLFTVLTSPSIASRVRLNSTTVPLHYDIELTIEENSFTVQESILITVLEDTQEIEINANGFNSTPWLTNCRLASADGREVLPYESEEIEKGFLLLRFEDVIPGGFNYTLSFTDVKGSFGAGLVEVPLTIPNDSDDSSGLYLLSTGFNRTSLRALFPCFDQPEFRTTYKFTVYHQEEYTLVSNSEEVIREGPIVTRNLFVRSTFEIARPLPTSSIGLALTNMPVQSSTDNRVRVYHTNPAMATIFLDTYHSLLLAVEKEFNFSLAIPKIDIISVPSLPWKTLTKWGLISVGPEMTPVANSLVHSVELKVVQKEISRSIYRLFFGQLMNVEWWVQEWVTQGMATYFSGTSKHLPFDAEKEFLSDTVQYVIRDKIGRDLPPGFGFYVTEQIDSQDDLQIDQTAATVMRLVANVIGQDNFKAAAVALLAINRDSVITSDQFLEHLSPYADAALLPERENLPSLVKDLMDGIYYRYDIYVETVMDKFSLTSSYRQVRYVPIDYMTPSEGSANQTKLWCAFYHTPKVEIDKEQWIVVNPQQLGIYRVVYSDALWAELIVQVRDNPEMFNRGQLISDSLYWEGSMPVNNHLNLIRYLPNEMDALTWRVARITFEDMALLTRNFEEADLFFEYYQSLTRDLYSKNRLGKEMEDFELALEVARIACSSGLPECLQDVEEYYAEQIELKEGIKGSSEFQTLIYCTLAKYSNTTILDDVMQLWIKDRRVHSQSRNAVKGLACTSDAEIVDMFLHVASSDQLEIDHGITLTSPERSFLLTTFMSGSHESVVQSLKFIRKKENFEAIEDRVTSTNDLFEGIGYYIRSNEVFNLVAEIEYEYFRVGLSYFTTNIYREKIQGFASLRDSKYKQEQFLVWVGKNSEGNVVKVVNGVLLMGLVAFIRFVCY